METQYFVATNETMQHYTDQALSERFCSRVFGVTTPLPSLPRLDRITVCLAHEVGRFGLLVVEVCRRHRGTTLPDALDDT